MSQQLLVEGRCHFREENWIIVILKRLSLLREPGVHRMPCFMSKGVNIGEHILFVVHQDVRRRAVTAGREGAAAFSLGLVTIAPPAAKTFSEGADVFFS